VLAASAAAHAEPCLQIPPAERRTELPRLYDRQCKRLQELDLPQLGVGARLVVEVGAAPVPGTTQDAVLEGLRRGDAAAARFGGRLRVPPLTVMLARDFERTATEQAEAFVAGGRCTVVVAPTAWQGAARPDLSFTLAHELFHCVEQQTLGVRSAWWTEGAAEWFAHEAIADAPLAFVDRHELSADRKALTRLDYAAWPFFAWYASRVGTAAVFDYLRAQGRGDPAAESVGAGLPAAAWRDYATTAASYRITLPDGRRILPAARAPRRQRLGEDGATIALSLRPAQMVRETLLLPSGVWRLAGEAPAATALAWSLIDDSGMPDGVWISLGNVSTIVVPCARQLRLMLAGASAMPATAHLRLTRLGEACDATHCGALPFRPDACFVGDWQLRDARSGNALTRWLGTARKAAAPAGLQLQADGLLMIDELPPEAAAKRRSYGAWGQRGAELTMCALGLRLAAPAGRVAGSQLQALPAQKERYRFACRPNRLVLDGAGHDGRPLHAEYARRPPPR
jgi:hypothetical protein